MYNIYVLYTRCMKIQCVKYNACPHIADASGNARPETFIHRAYFYLKFIQIYLFHPNLFAFQPGRYVSFVCARFFGPEIRLSAAKSGVFDHPARPHPPPCPGDPIVRSRIMRSRIVWSRIMRSRIICGHVFYSRIVWSRIL